MKIKKTAFTNIGQHLMTLLQPYDAIAAPNGIIPADSGIPGLKWFDKQMGQFTNPQLALAIPLPCILMEYQNFSWETVGKMQQRGNGVIRFYIYFENYADTFDGSVNQELALNFFEFTGYANQVLQGYGFEGMTPLLIVADNEDNAEDMIITSTVDYGTILTNVATEEARNFTLVDPAIIVEKVDSTGRPTRPNFHDGFIIPQ